jgi:hypothetical protein
MATVNGRGNPSIIRVEIYTHVLAVTTHCPFCGEQIKHTWLRTERKQRFDPPLLWCTCGRYAYAPSTRE